MNFELTDVQHAWRDKAAALAAALAPDAAASDVVSGAARVGLLDPRADLLSLVVAVDALATESPADATVLALHSAAAMTVAGDARYTSVFTGETVAALTLATEQIPVQSDGTVSGHASWVGPITNDGVAIIAIRQESGLVAGAVELHDPTVRLEPVPTAALRGFVCGHLTLTATPVVPLGPTLPVMARARLLLAAVGLGIARRAVREALRAARGTSRGAGGEQTVQGLVADAATDLDAAMLLTWKAAAEELTLAQASMAKLAATGAAQRAVERATQAVGAETFRRGHIVERMAQDVRALELFAGRTETLRDAVAEHELPPVR